MVVSNNTKFGGDYEMAEKEKMKNIQRVQILSQQLKALEDQLQVFERRKIEVSHALEELKKAEEKGEKTVYQFLGANILVEKDLESVKEELEEELTALESRINLIKKQLDVGKKELERLLKDLGYLGGPPETVGG
ncbi:MAG: hypothetical protein DRJ44_04435 [Thermoprotei archaeon]|nr:MAG: hypothetical protein DRJ44_04435 [Thermoprotei archaeon]